jgi:hypothetical protein
MNSRKASSQTGGRRRKGCSIEGCQFIPTTQIRISSSMGSEKHWFCDFHADNLLEAQQQANLKAEYEAMQEDAEP